MTASVSTPSAAPLIESLSIPAGAASSLDSFRNWAESEDFPQSGRIDYLAGSIEVDMSPEDLQTHGTPKGEIHAYVHALVKRENLGQVFVDRTVLSSQAANLHCEPDILYVSLEALKAGRVRYRPSARKRDHYTEVEGAADLAVEVVSDSSVGKDMQRLPPLYAQAGLRELWLVDARGEELRFEILHLHEGAYRPAPADKKGFRKSLVLGRRLRLRREPWELPGTWQYSVEEA
jgi:Uma2 family endonuclease